jgi:lactoylglutathione lyase
MRAFLRLTPNLVVRDVEESIRFYTDVLGFELDKHVPDQPPFVFASVRGGGVELFLNQQSTVVDEYPAFRNVPIGGTFTLFMVVQGVDALHCEVEKHGTRIVMPLVTKFYGMREFAFVDPDGYVITLAERIG